MPGIALIFRTGVLRRSKRNNNGAGKNEDWERAHAAPHLLHAMIRLQSDGIAVFIFLVIFCLASPPLSASAESSVQCHCFMDRTYNPDDRFAADDYILATTFNSLLARFFTIPKSQVVLIKMKEGVSQEELLIGLKLSQATGEDPRTMLEARQENMSWPQIIASRSQQETVKKDKMLAAIRAGMPAAEAGDKIADDMIGEFFGITPDAIRKLRRAGLNEKEITLVYILATSRARKPEELVAMHGSQGKSWSEIANMLGFKPSTAGKLILSYPGVRKAE